MIERENVRPVLCENEGGLPKPTRDYHAISLLHTRNTHDFVLLYFPMTIDPKEYSMRTQVYYFFFHSSLKPAGLRADAEDALDTSLE